MSTGRFIVCGGRDYADVDVVRDALAAVPRGMTLVNGDAPGADRLAATIWRTSRRGPVESYPANWGRFGKGAGPKRNQVMADRGGDFLLAFPGGRGTADMTRRAAAAGIEVRPVGLSEPRIGRTS